jgi:hypothetical protein
MPYTLHICSNSGDEEKEEAEIEPAGDDLLNPHDQKWVDDGEVEFDVEAYRSRPELLWHNNGMDNAKTPLDCFNLAFPRSKLKSYVDETNTRISSLPRK